MAHLVGRRSPKIEGIDGTAALAETRGEDDHAVGLRRTARELGVAKHPAMEWADPDVEIPRSVPRASPTRGVGLHPVIDAKWSRARLPVCDAVCGRSGRV